MDAQNMYYLLTENKSFLIKYCTSIQWLRVLLEQLIH